jgi:hypothetical protein
MILYFCFVETTCSHGSVGTIDPRLVEWRELRLVWTARVLMELVLRGPV